MINMYKLFDRYTRHLPGYEKVYLPRSKHQTSTTFEFLGSNAPFWENILPDSNSEVNLYPAFEIQNFPFSYTLKNIFKRLFN